MNPGKYFSHKISVTPMCLHVRTIVCRTHFAWDCNQKVLSLKPEAFVLSCHPPMSLPLETMFCCVHAYFHLRIKLPYTHFIFSFGTFLLSRITHSISGPPPSATPSLSLFLLSQFNLYFSCGQKNVFFNLGPNLPGPNLSNRS